MAEKKPTQTELLTAIVQQNHRLYELVGPLFAALNAGLQQRDKAIANQAIAAYKAQQEQKDEPKEE